MRVAARPGRDGVPLNDAQRARLARDFQRAVGRVAPDWTGGNAHDPGITMLELFAFVLDDLQHHKAILDPHGRRLARALAGHASALAATATATATTGDAGDCPPGLRRVSYFAGELLGVDDFRTEQDYVRDRLDRRNRLMHGTGIVDGLAVTVTTDPAGAHVAIAPGLAFAPDGSEIVVDAPSVLPLPTSGSDAALLVQLAYREVPCRPVVGGSTTQPSRVVETFVATLAALPDADAVAIARVLRVRGRWRIEPKFKASRARR